MSLSFNGFVFIRVKMKMNSREAEWQGDRKKAIPF